MFNPVWLTVHIHIQTDAVYLCLGNLWSLLELTLLNQMPLKRTATVSKQWKMSQMSIMFPNRFHITLLGAKIHCHKYRFTAVRKKSTTCLWICSLSLCCAMNWLSFRTSRIVPFISRLYLCSNLCFSKDSLLPPVRFFRPSKLRKQTLWHKDKMSNHNYNSHSSKLQSCLYVAVT